PSFVVTEVAIMLRRSDLMLVALALVAVMSSTAGAGPLSDPGSAGFAPRVPVSLFARPSLGLDLSRLHFSSTTTVGTSSGWGGTQALQTTSLSYEFKAPAKLRVSLGNAFGSGSANGSSFFLQGLDFTYQPTRNSMFRVQFNNVRSPLQYRGFDPDGYGYGYSGFDRAYSAY
ncbi:MAG: hypothetical protein ABIU54_01325, partial [Candidatus Eisenbacteria bacterium]